MSTDVFFTEPFLYIASRVSRPMAWRKRSRLFRKRPKLKLVDHAENFECPDDTVRLLRLFLKWTHMSFGVPVTRLRPEDRVDVELKFPSLRLHAAMMNEFFESLECTLVEFECGFFPPPFDNIDLHRCSLKQLFDHLLYCIHENKTRPPNESDSLV